MSAVVISGDTSGSVTLQAPAVAGSTTLTLPATTGTVALATQVPAVLLTSTNYATTSGTTVDATGIPSGVKRITVVFDNVSTNGSSNPLIQIGDSGGIETTGYLGGASAITSVVTSSNYTAGFGIPSASSLSVLHGSVVLSNVTGNTWAASGVVCTSNTIALYPVAGTKTLSATLDRVRLTTVNGTDTFDAGSITVIYEG